MELSKRGGLSRRRLLGIGLGIAGGFAAKTSIAGPCKGAVTATQGLGPFFPVDRTPEDPVRENPDKNLPISLANDNDLTFVKGREGKAQGQEVLIRGILRDSQCQPIEGATIIIWQASHSGKYNHKRDNANLDFAHPKTGETLTREHDKKFQYWGKAETNERGEYVFKTIVPGFYPAALRDLKNPDAPENWYRPPHVHFRVLASGHEEFVTQMYFRGEDLENNAFIQQLNQSDDLLTKTGLSPEEIEGLIVDFAKNERGELQGDFEINLP